MNIKKIVLFVVFGIGVTAAAAPVSADGGMMTITAEPVSLTLTPKTVSTEARVANLAQLVSLYSQVLALTIGIPEATSDDEGVLTVVVNDAMTFPCDGKGGHIGTQCLRHMSGELGESYVDLGAIPGHTHDERFAYSLSVMRSQSGEETMPYTYHLVGLSDVQYEG